MVFGKEHHNFHVSCLVNKIENYYSGMHIKTKEDLSNREKMIYHYRIQFGVVCTSVTHSQ